MGTNTSVQHVTSTVFARNDILMGVNVVYLDENWVKKPSMKLLMDQEMCKLIKTNAEKAIENIQALLSDIDKFNPRNSLHDFIMDFRGKLGKYSIFPNVCRWEEADDDLRKMVNLVDECYQSLICKFDFSLGDFRQMLNILETTMCVFERKLEMMDELL